MMPERRSARGNTVGWPLSVALAGVLGCASPGPPKPPSLRLPEPVRDLKAQRSGNTVELTFHAPERSTDKDPLPPPSVRGTVCREVEKQGCVTVAGLTAEVAVPSGAKKKAAAPGAALTLQDTLPPALTQGPDRLLTYRVEFFNASGRSAGPGDAAYTVAGQAPEQVRDLKAEGARPGTILRWQPAPGETGSVLLHREEVAPHAPAGKKPQTEPSQWLDTHAIAGGFEGDQTLDATAEPDVLYRYTAVRRRTVTLAGHTLELRSAPSSPVEFLLHPVYPPAAPTGLSAAGFATEHGYAVDLIWQPVDDPGLAGYNVYRLDEAGKKIKLNAAPLPLPAFHDVAATAGRGYAVTAVDARGNESAPATATP